MDKNELYIRHMLDAIQAIEEYLVDFDYEKFLSKSMAQDAVIRQLSIIGEAAKRLTDELKEKHSKIPWKDVCGMRDKLIHDYFGIDLKEVWETATQDLKKLKQSLNNYNIK